MNPNSPPGTLIDFMNIGSCVGIPQEIEAVVNHFSLFFPILILNFIDLFSTYPSPLH